MEGGNSIAISSVFVVGRPFSSLRATRTTLSFREKGMSLVNVEQKERGETWSTMPLQVCGRLVELTGRKVSQTIVRFHPRSTQTIECYFTLYDTPDEGYKVYLVESLYNSPDVVSRSSQRFLEGTTSRILFSEEEARRYYPAVLEQLIRQKRIKEKFGL
jgi:hypothetical protein